MRYLKAGRNWPRPVFFLWACLITKRFRNFVIFNGQTHSMSMKFYFSAVAFLFLSVSLFSQSSSPDEIMGIWNSNLGKGHVELAKDSSGQKYCGKIIWLKAPQYPDGTDKMDKNNPDKTKRNQPLIGLMVVKNLTFVKDHWENGTIYDPETGKTYSCKATLKGDKLELRGYIGISQIGRTQTWERVK